MAPNYTPPPIVVLMPSHERSEGAPDSLLALTNSSYVDLGLFRKQPQTTDEIDETEEINTSYCRLGFIQQI